MRMPRRMLTTLAVSSAAMLLLAAPASAASLSGNISGRANASASWTWHHSSVRSINISVDDLKCDAEGAYAYLRVYQPGTEDGYKDIAGVGDSCGGGPTSRTGLNFDGSKRISGVRLVVCVDSTGSDTCDRDNFVANPIS